MLADLLLFKGDPLYNRILDADCMNHTHGVLNGFIEKKSTKDPNPQTQNWARPL